MRITLTERFQHDARSLDAGQRASLLDVVIALPKVIAQVHLHSGLGMRKIHRSGVWEARVGRDLRVVFLLGSGEIILVTIGTHDDVRRFLRTL
jgi:mRNA-degrading endonuclease YafQ of YafQ-DinJ toxin-antitoxin module